MAQRKKTTAALKTDADHAQSPQSGLFD